MYEAVTSILNIGLLLLTLYTKLQISKIQNQFQQEGRDTKDLILNTVNGKYVKTDLYNERHTHIMNKLSEIHDKEVELTNKYDLLEQQQNSIERKIILLTANCDNQHNQHNINKQKNVDK